MHQVTTPENMPGWAGPVSRGPVDPIWNLLKIRADAAHRTGFKGEGVRVAVLDTGIQMNHPHFGGMVTRGANFVPNEADMDLNGHGTHVAGIVHSVAPDATIVDVKVLDINSSGIWGVLASAIVWASTQGQCQVINMSLGGGGGDMPAVMHDAIATARDQGAILVAASGNVAGSDPFWPAFDPAVWSIGACDENGQLWPLTTIGDIDLLAPGVCVNSSVPNGGYGVYTGTSMAAPHVSACMAIALSRNGLDSEAARMSVVGEGDSARVVDAAKSVGINDTIWLPFVGF